MSALNIKSVSQTMLGLLRIADFPWVVNDLMVPNNVVFVNNHGTILGRAQLTEDFTIPKGTKRVVVSKN